MKEEDVIALLALQHTPNVGDITAKKLIAHCGRPAAIYHEKKHKIARIGGVGNVILQHLFDPITTLFLIMIILPTSSRLLMRLFFSFPVEI